MCGGNVSPHRNEETMYLTDEQKAILDGSKGETMAKVMESVVRYGELFGAEKLIPITSDYTTVSGFRS